jgi:hypothetical protein
MVTASGTAEQQRLVEAREDYSDNGDAWSYFSHDQARSRAYHWGEAAYRKYKATFHARPPSSASQHPAQ